MYTIQNQQTICTWKQLIATRPTDYRCRITNFNNFLWTSHIGNLDDSEILYFPTSNNPLELKTQLTDVDNQDLEIEIDYFTRNNPRGTLINNLSRLAIQYNKQTDPISSSKGLSFKPTIDLRSNQFLASNVKLSTKNHLNPNLEKYSRVSLYYYSALQINRIELTFLVKLPKLKVQKLVQKAEKPTKTFLHKWTLQKDDGDIQKDWLYFNQFINNGHSELSSILNQNNRDKGNDYYLHNSGNSSF